MKATVIDIQYYLPEQILDNIQLSSEFLEWTPEKIEEKTGITQRHIASEDEYASDLAVKAAKKILKNHPNLNIDLLIVCTQSPDYLIPTTACLVQEKLGLNTQVGAFDINLGCSGYIYGLSIAKGLIESKQAETILLLTVDTYSKYIEPTDKTVKTIFGDGAAATLLTACDSVNDYISPSVFGTDGRGAENLMVRSSGLKKDTDPFLRMNGGEIFSFTLKVIPPLVEAILKKTNKTLPQIDLFVFHQANAYMLKHLQKKLGIPDEKFLIAMDFCGNTVSSSIPIALVEAKKKNLLENCRYVLLVGFGVGYSWGATLVDVSSFNKYGSYEE